MRDRSSGAAAAPAVPENPEHAEGEVRLDSDVVRAYRPAPVSPFRHHRPRCFAITLALVALVVRLLLPVLHEHRGGEGHAGDGRDGAATASSCPCAPMPTTTVWWHASNDGGGANGDDADGDDDGADDRAPTPTASASTAASSCLACAEELLPVAAPAPLTIAAAPATPTRAHAPTPPPAPRCAAVRARHPCRAPPTTAA